MPKIAVFAGHGGSDPGAVYGDRLEKDFNLEIALAVTEILRSHGYEVLNNRTEDVDRSITQDAKLANQANVDAVVEIHLNAGGGTGTEVFYGIDDDASRNLAIEIVDRIAELGFTNRGVKTRLAADGRDYFGIIRETYAPAVLVEAFFIDNDEDYLLYDPVTMSQAIADGIMAVFGEGITEPDIDDGEGQIEPDTGDMIDDIN